MLCLLTFYQRRSRKNNLIWKFIKKRSDFTSRIIDCTRLNVAFLNKSPGSPLNRKLAAMSGAVSGIWRFSVLIQRTWKTSALISSVSKLISSGVLWISAVQNWKKNQRCFIENQLCISADFLSCETEFSRHVDGIIQSYNCALPENLWAALKTQFWRTKKFLAEQGGYRADYRWDFNSGKHLH